MNRVQILPTTTSFSRSWGNWGGGGWGGGRYWGPHLQNWNTDCLELKRQFPKTKWQLLHNKKTTERDHFKITKFCLKTLNIPHSYYFSLRVNIFWFTLLNMFISDPRHGIRRDLNTDHWLLLVRRKLPFTHGFSLEAKNKVYTLSLTYIYSSFSSITVNTTVYTLRESATYVATEIGAQGHIA